MFTVTKKETSEQRIGRQARNAWISSLGFCDKSELWAKIKMKNDQLKPLKRSFGEKYMDMIESGASAKELDQCVQASLREIKAIKNDIAELKAAVARIEEKTNNKLRKKPEVRGRPKWLFPVA
jgi:predicted RNase H-like nuclease (RuvC/YqgF family)